MKNIKVRTKKQAAGSEEKDILKLKRHFQVTLPQSLRKKLNLNVGDYLEVDWENGKIILRPVKVVHPGQEYFFTKEWQEGETEADEDIMKGRITGPFDDVKSALKALKKTKK